MGGQGGGGLLRLAVRVRYPLSFCAWWENCASWLQSSELITDVLISVMSVWGFEVSVWSVSSQLNCHRGVPVLYLMDTQLFVLQTTSWSTTSSRSVSSRRTIITTLPSTLWPHLSRYHVKKLHLYVWFCFKKVFLGNTKSNLSCSFLSPVSEGEQEPGHVHQRIQQLQPQHHLVCGINRYVYLMLKFMYRAGKKKARSIFFSFFLTLTRTKPYARHIIDSNLIRVDGISPFPSLFLN